MQQDDYNLIFYEGVGGEEQEEYSKGLEFSFSSGKE